MNRKLITAIIIIVFCSGCGVFSRDRHVTYENDDLEQRVERLEKVVFSE